MNLLLPMTVAGLLVTGMGVALLGSVKVDLARKLDIDEARVGGLVSMFGFAMIPVILTVGFVTDFAGKQAVLAAGCLLMFVSLILLSRSSRYWTAMVAVLLFSAAWSAMINVINVLTPPAFLEPSEIPERMAYATNLANVFFGVGAFLTPLIIAFLLRRFGFAPSLQVLAAVVLIPAVMSVGVDFAALEAAPADQSTSQTASGLTTLLGDPVLWLCAFALFFYGPLEAAMGAWATTYLGERGVSEGLASTLLSAFWLSFMASRLLTAWLATPFHLPDGGETLLLPAGSESALILGLSLACIVVMSGVVWNQNRGVAIALVCAAGLVFGPVFPSIMAILLGHFDASLHGRAVGLLFAIGGVGWTMIPILMGTYARRTSVQRSFLIAVASAVGLLATAAMMIALIVK